MPTLQHGGVTPGINVDSYEMHGLSYFGSVNTLGGTVLPAKSDGDDMFCLQLLN